MGILLAEPLGYLDFMALVAGSRIVLTDSGGLQEETTWHRIPCVTLRTSTERPHRPQHLLDRIRIGDRSQQTTDMSEITQSAEIALLLTELW
jgi:UDP-N-acetylglucosamine 2-epimerase